MRHSQAVQGEKKEKKNKVVMITKDTKFLLPSSIFYEHSPCTFHIINHVFNNGMKTTTEATHLRQTGNVRLKSQVAAWKYKRTHGFYNFLVWFVNEVQIPMGNINSLNGFG